MSGDFFYCEYIHIMNASCHLESLVMKLGLIRTKRNTKKIFWSFWPHKIQRWVKRMLRNIVTRSFIFRRRLCQLWLISTGIMLGFSFSSFCSTDSLAIYFILSFHRCHLYKFWWFYSWNPSAYYGSHDRMSCMMSLEMIIFSSSGITQVTAVFLHLSLRSIRKSCYRCCCCWYIDWLDFFASKKSHRFGRSSINSSTLRWWSRTYRIPYVSSSCSVSYYLDQ